MVEVLWMVQLGQRCGACGRLLPLTLARAALAVNVLFPPHPFRDWPFGLRQSNTTLGLVQVFDWVNVGYL